MSNTYKRKTPPISAIQWDGKNTNQVIELAEAKGATPTGNVLIFSNNFNSYTMRNGDYLVKEGKSMWIMPKESFEDEFEKEVE